MSGSGSALVLISSGSSRAIVSAIAPPLLSDPWNEADPAKVLGDELAGRAPRDLDQLLDPVRLADGHDDPPALRQLIDPGLRDMASARGGQDGVVRRSGLPAARPVAFNNAHIVIAEPL